MRNTHPSTTQRIAAASAVALLALGTAACGSDDDEVDTPSVDTVVDGAGDAVDDAGQTVTSEMVDGAATADSAMADATGS